MNKYQRLFKLIKSRGFGSLSFLASFFLSLIRGILHGYPLVLIGKGVTLRQKSKIDIGKFSRIEDYCELDGFGSKGIKIGRECKIGKFSILRVPSSPFLKGKQITIDDFSTIGEFCFIGGAASVKIGKNNSIGQYVSIHPQNHITSSKETLLEELGITIGDSNWIGAKTTFLDGSEIGNGNIVGAKTTITKKFGDNLKILGTPAKEI